ncbi:MAG: ABC transporter permease subunit [Treponema sp.]|nr:ABC transporter permease subunit [Treponema sp.]
MIPIFAYYILLRYWPMLMQIILSFKNYRLDQGIWGSMWVGFDNFKTLFGRYDFLPVLRNTIILSLYQLVFNFFPPIILAILLFDLRRQIVRRTAQTLLYIPHFFSWVIIYAIVFSAFSPDGFVNQITKILNNGKFINFLVLPQYFRPLIVGSALFKDIGWGTIIYLAALSGIDPGLFDAAKIDGAGPIQRIWHITLPSVAPVVVFLFTLAIGNILTAPVEQILLFLTPASMTVGDVIGTWVYRVGIGQMRYSLTATMNFFQSAIGLVLVLTANYVAQKTVGRGIW